MRKTYLAFPFIALCVLLCTLAGCRRSSERANHLDFSSRRNSSDQVVPNATEAASIRIAADRAVAKQTPERISTKDTLSKHPENQPDSLDNGRGVTQQTVMPESASDIDGFWRVISMEKDGHQTEPNVDTHYQFDEGRLIVISAGLPSADLTYQTNQSVSPCHLDVKLQRSQGIELSRMIYRIDGDTLTIVYPNPGEPRPQRLRVRSGDQMTLIQMERVSVENLNVGTANQPSEIPSSDGESSAKQIGKIILRIGQAIATGIRQESSRA